MSEKPEKPIKTIEHVHFSAILPPSLICLAIAMIGIVLHELWPISAFETFISLRLAIGGAFMVAGVVLLLVCMRLFHQNGEKLSQKASTKTIIETGPYGVSRNPMYLSYLIITMGWALTWGNIWVMILLIPASLLIHEGVVRREEHYLRAKFADEYKRYKLNVNRWL
jgi:protein-S-isoprenylcysteine O-methyltransferase Ste14